MSNSVRSIRMEVAAGIEVQGAENPSAVFNVAHAKIGDRVKLLLEPWGERFGRFFLANINRILSNARLVAWPEIELVLGCFGTLVINQWSVGNMRPGFRQIEGDFADQTVMRADDEGRFAFL